VTYSVKRDSTPPVLIQWTEEIDFIVNAVHMALHKFALHAVITSGMEGSHRRASKHFKSEAVDFRIVWPAAQRDAVLKAIMDMLKPRARYILETDHLHVETV